MEKDTKIILGTVLILLVAMFSFNFVKSNEVTGQLTNPIFNTGTLPTPTQQIRANSCDADNICEANWVLTKKIDTDKLGANSAIIQSVQIKGKTVSTLPGSTSSLTLTSDTKEVIIDDKLQTKTLISDAVIGNIAKFGGTNLVPAFYVYSPPGASAGVSAVEINGKSSFDDVAEFTTAYADNFKARNHVSANILTVTSASAPLNPVGNSNAYACFDKYGNLFRKNSPCI